MLKTREILEDRLKIEASINICKFALLAKESVRENIFFNSGLFVRQSSAM